MSDAPEHPVMRPDAAALQRRRVRLRDERLQRWGMRGWYLIGVFASVSLVFGVVSAVSGLVIPLVVAMVVGALFVPFVDRLAERMPRILASSIVLFGLAGVIGLSMYLTVVGIVDHAPEIGRRLAAGFDDLFARLGTDSLDRGDGDSVVDGLSHVWNAVRRGLAGSLTTVFASTAAFFAGMFVATILLFFILDDWPSLSAWVAEHLGVGTETGTEIVEDGTWSLRQYFMALSISSLIVAAIVGTTAAILGMPLVVAITVVTFFTSYIPYIGALFSGTFAVLIALSSGGMRDAIVILVVVLVAQNVVQTVVQMKLSKDRLSLHPIVIFGSTIAGGAIFGLLGAALSTPVAAMLVRVSRRLSESRAEEAEAEYEP